MTSRQKRLARIRANPKQVRFLEMARLLEEVGFGMRRSKRGTSHYVFFHDHLDQVVVLVSHGQNDLLPDYQVRQALVAINRVLGWEEEE